MPVRSLPKRNPTANYDFWLISRKYTMGFRMSTSTILMPSIHSLTPLNTLTPITWQARNFFFQIGLLSGLPLPRNGKTKVHKNTRLQLNKMLPVELSSIADWHKPLVESLSAVLSFLSKSLDKNLKTDQCAQYVEIIDTILMMLRNLSKPPGPHSNVFRRPA